MSATVRDIVLTSSPTLIYTEKKVLTTMEGSSIQATSLERKAPEERETLEEPEDLTQLTAIQNRSDFLSS